jgi:hypothetical protein
MYTYVRTYIHVYIHTHKHAYTQMEMDAVQQAYVLEREQGLAAVRTLLHDRSILRAAVRHLIM